MLSATLAACGLYTPAKDPLSDDSVNPISGKTKQGSYENLIVDHVTCEISQGLYEAKRLQLPWLEKWGTTVTQTITAEDQSGLSPGLSTIAPFHNVIFPFSPGGNVTSPQSFLLSFGGAASANALRTETIQYTFRNSDIVHIVDPGTCASKQTGVMIDGDLKIREFIYDKAMIAALGNARLSGTVSPANDGSITTPKNTMTTPKKKKVVLAGWQQPVFNTFTEEITFVAAFGGSFTPTWHLARLSANTSSNLLIGERTNTNDLIITLGPLDTTQPANSPVQLVAAAMNQHNARVTAAAIAVSIQSQSH